MLLIKQLAAMLPARVVVVESIRSVVALILKLVYKGRELVMKKCNRRLRG
jgi:hypothetical protein